MEDNKVMLETKRMFEDQIKTLQFRSDKLHVVEKENLQLKAKLHEMELVSVNGWWKNLLKILEFYLYF